MNGQKTSLVKRTYSQAVRGGPLEKGVPLSHSSSSGSIDEDGFKLVLSKKEKKETRRVSSLGVRMPEGLKSVEEVPEWEVPVSYTHLTLPTMVQV